MTVDVESELRSLQRTYRSSGFRLTKLLSPAQIRIALDFECKDPDYRQHYPRLKSLPLEIVLPDDYPNDAPRFRIVDGRPEPIRRVITQGLDWFCEGRRGQPMIIASLKWLDDNLDGLMSLGSQLLSQESQKSASKTEDANDWSPEQQSQLENALKLVPKSAAPSPEQRWLRIADHVQGKSAEQCIERFRTIRSALQAEQERQSKVQKITANLQEIAFESASSAPLEPIQEPNTVPLSQCMQVAFPSIQLLSIAMARMQLARFSCRCSRCRTMFDMALTPTQTQNGVCQKCHEPWTALFSFEIVHIANCRFGNVQTVNCDIIDYLPSNVWISCERCSSDLLLERIETGPKKCYATCRECHSHMTLICGEVVLSESSCSRSVLPTAKPKQETPQKKRLARALQTSDSGIIKKGEPLPDFGTCKHYSKSYRWLRFPCCGKAFPCDICHELGTASNPHAMKWALRQICGFCAQESAIIGSGKCPCGKSTTRANSEYWNGGQGMRDQSRMARNDSKKHAGLLKTRSQKHKRVGQKPS